MNNFDDRGYSPISGEGVFKPQDIDTRGSVIVGDNHFKPGRGGDSLTGESRPTKIWTNGGASTFEDRVFGDFDANDFHACPNKVKDLAGNMTEIFEPIAAMTSFAGFFNHVPGGEGFQPREGASVEIGNPPEPKLWLQILG